MCAAQRVGLVDYPTTSTRASGSQTVITQCADNAHRSSSSLNAFCSSTGSWSGSPQCECDDGYEVMTVNGRQKCVCSSPSSSSCACPSPRFLSMSKITYLKKDMVT